MRGPIDYIVVGFEGNKFDGSILSAIADAIEKGTIALVALVVVSKDDKGVLTTLDIADMGDAFVAEFTQKYPGQPELVTADDVSEIGDVLENSTTAGLLVIEHLWAKPLKQALINANGVLVAEGRIHPDAAMELEGKEK